MVFTSGPNTQETHNLLDRLEEFGRSHPGHGSRKWRTYGDYLFDIVVNLSQKGYGEQLKEFVVSAGEYGRHYEGPYPEDNTSGLVITGNMYGNFVFSKTEPLIYKQDARIDKESQYGAMWSVFDRLIKLYEAFSARSKGMSQNDFLNDYNQRHPARNEVEANDMWDVNLAFGDLADLNLSDEERKGYVPPRAQRPYTQFLRLDEFKGLASRAHRYLLKELSAYETKANKNSASFDEGRGVLHVAGKEVRFRKFTEQYHALASVFSDPKDLGNERFFSELAEKIDAVKGYTNKQFHNYFSAIKRKVAAETTIKDLFITTTQSVKINPDYLN
jgi:hypothetical protein